MAVIAKVAADVRSTHPASAKIFDAIAAVDLAPGDIFTLNASGKAVLADANATGLKAPRGMALTYANAGYPGFSYLMEGFVAGFDLSARAFGDAVFLSDTPGAIEEVASATTTVLVGSVQQIPSGDTPTKMLYVNFNQNVANS